LNNERNHPAGEFGNLASYNKQRVKQDSNEIILDVSKNNWFHRQLEHCQLILVFYYLPFNK